MKKKLDTRFPAARIKKIMQTDEDVGKIALAVPVLVSKALELFLQDLCDRTYEITLQRGAKTMNSLHFPSWQKTIKFSYTLGHLAAVSTSLLPKDKPVYTTEKHCVQSYNVFDFLRDVVGRVPDYGHGHGHTDSGADDRTISRRRKAAGDDCKDSDEEANLSKMREFNHAGSRGRGRGRVRGRGRGRGRGARAVEREAYCQEAETEPPTSVQQGSLHDCNTSVTAIFNGSESKELPKETIVVPVESSESLHTIDLNANMNHMDKNASIAANASLSETAAEPATESKHEELPGWSLSDVDKMAVDSMQLAHLGGRLEEEEEDYDEEG